MKILEWPLDERKRLPWFRKEVRIERQPGGRWVAYFSQQGIPVMVAQGKFLLGMLWDLRAYLQREVDEGDYASVQQVVNMGLNDSVPYGKRFLE